MICTSIGNIVSTKNYYGSLPTKILEDFYVVCLHLSWV